MIIKTRVEKIGDMESYINLPVTDGLVCNVFEKETKAIGVIVAVAEVEDKYELTINIWDRFITQNLELSNEQPSCLSINFI